MTFVSIALRWVCGALLAALVAIVSIAVFYRYALNASLYWATEVPNFILVWMVFLGSVVAFHEKKHIAFDLVTSSSPPPMRRTLEALSALTVIGFLGLMIHFGVKLVASTMDSPSEALKIPQGWLYLCLPLSAGLMMASALQQLWATLTGRGTEAGA
ncbi:hypothetical protein ABB55_25575 [Prosthecomicrobium hirschii]|uniref:TRAP transporter small permease protein n=1 Tax=Prosthecodimorpha hirschii TaxID=665126 RepID=A0A0P6W7R8_9HYPH|nr:TRAP transporter small permease [Prosthecomicrobium hirschii]KPL55187.1 hypothetical protein ABB55_25575 [Prosthecomicrobium hirschii]